MLRVIIIDITHDEIQHLAACVAAAMPDTRLIAHTTDCKEGLRQIEDYRPDLVFLNITMMQEDYFVVLKHICWSGYFLVYTAPDSGYALKALRNNAFDYIINAEQELPAVWSRICKKQDATFNADGPFSQEEIKRLAIPASAEEVLYERSENVLRLEAESNYTQIRLADKRTFLVSKTLKYYEGILCSRGFSFMRVHQSYIINLHYVSRFIREEQGLIIMKDNATVPLSKTKRNDFMRWLGTC